MKANGAGRWPCALGGPIDDVEANNPRQDGLVIGEKEKRNSPTEDYVGLLEHRRNCHSGVAGSKEGSSPAPTDRESSTGRRGFGTIDSSTLPEKTCLIVLKATFPLYHGLISGWSSRLWSDSEHCPCLICCVTLGVELDDFTKDAVCLE